MTLQDKFVQAVSSTRNGVAVKEMAKILKGNEDTVYQTANSIRRKGGIVTMKDHCYTQASLPIGNEIVKVKTHVSEAKSLIDMAVDLDPQAKYDFIDQMTKANLHRGIAEQIVKSHNERRMLERKLGV